MKKSLGQHLLLNKTAIQKIVQATNPQRGELIIEIGPGAGALTLPLIKKCGVVGAGLIAIEKDAALAQKLKIKKEGVKIIAGDALKILPAIMQESLFMIHNYKIVGNIPYYITGKLLRIISELEYKPALAILMIQKEVAERIIARPPKMNLLAAAVQYWATPQLLFNLKPGDFNPPPMVSSAVISLTPNGKTNGSKTTDSYYRLIRALFKQPRKTILNNLKSGLSITSKEATEILKKESLNPNDRPQNLSIEQIKNLAKFMRSDLVNYYSKIKS